ncbi:hypothetical protein FN976_06785 [Caenimonas sedimenti]|uniref:Uncharacterized protein n=1 Tax=Caenimonas sedimenti TaxID=2596921 RepID=A0A562ZUX8_9BURK|nr:hypothetical protein [Caenimonas sedimenti]TWO72402.1 hypothetical protein FN976_06785 [Caenimonas sedimenti]
MQAWRVDREVLAIGAVRIALQRIALAHWRADARLRSWGVAPLVVLDSASLAVPCWPEEALWLGAWGEDDAASAAIALHLPGGLGPVRIHLPAETAITSLEDAAGGARPLAWESPEQDHLVLELAVEHAGGRVALSLVLLRPATWEQRSGRPAPPPPQSPPPLPPRLG